MDFKFFTQTPIKLKPKVDLTSVSY